MSVRDKVGDSQLQSPSQKEQLGTIHRQHTFVKISKLRGEIKAPHWTTKREIKHIRRVKEVASL